MRDDEDYDYSDKREVWTEWITFIVVLVSIIALIIILNGCAIAFGTNSTAMVKDSPGDIDLKARREATPQSTPPAPRE